MKILVDENIPLMTVAELQSLGCDVLDVRGTPGEGMSDSSMWEMAQQQQRLLVTTDKGFAAKRQEPHWGILIAHLRQPNRIKIHRRVMEAVKRFDEAEWPGLVVMMRDNVMSVWPPR
jgi:predicted nuclease of predicted toxin-antitoxin system